MTSTSTSIVVLAAILAGAGLTVAGQSNSSIYRDPTYGDMVASTNADGSVDYYMCIGGDCTPEGAEWCGNCHASAQDKKKYDVRRHRTTHYPRAEYRLAPNEKLALRSATNLVLRDGALYRVGANGAPVLKLPAGSRVLKNRYGRPFAVHSPTRPIPQR